MVASLAVPPLFAALAHARCVLVAGAGGGFDVYAGLPLALALRADGREVHLANLSFSALELVDPDAWLDPDVAAVGPDTDGPDDYFPERTLARWLDGHGEPPTVYALRRTGVQPLRAAYRVLVERLGIDAYHGVNHVQVLENIAALDRAGGYLGALSIPGTTREAVLYRDAVAHAQAATPVRPSIVNGQIAAALAGEVGDVQFTRRTNGSSPFVNPLMAVYFSFDLDGLAKRCLYLDLLEETVGVRQVSGRIEWFRDGVDRRIPRAFPH